MIGPAPLDAAAVRGDGGHGAGAAPPLPAPQRVAGAGLHLLQVGGSSVISSLYLLQPSP